MAMPADTIPSSVLKTLSVVRGHREAETVTKTSQKWVPPSRQSQDLIRSALGECPLPAAGHPDFDHWDSAAIQARYSRIFEELPTHSGFRSDYKNPCWDAHREGDDFRVGRGDTVCLPYAYLLGMPKCGTSNLWTRIVQHESVEKTVKKVSLSLSLRGYYSILLASCVMWSAALDSSGVLLSYSVRSLA